MVLFMKSLPPVDHAPVHRHAADSVLAYLAIRPVYPMPPLSSLLESLFSAGAESVAEVVVQGTVEAAIDAVTHKNDDAADEPAPPTDTQVSAGS